jgi:peptide/nickel transport system substrate-binding protein
VGELESLNPLTDLNLTLSQISPLLYRSLNQLDPTTAQPSPYVATLPTFSTAGLTLTYQLITGTLSLTDVQTSLEAAIWPELADILTVTATAPNTFIVNLRQPNCPLVDRLAQLPILAEGTANSTMPLGSGPFQLERWDTETNELHFSPNTRPGVEQPRLEAITIRLFEDETSAWAALQAGELDLLPRRTLPGDLPAGYRSLAYSAPLLIFISFNNQDDILADPSVRQALSLAVERRQLLTRVFNDQGKLTAGPLHPDHWAADATLPIPPYDSAQAASLLDQAGLTDRDDDGWRDLPNGESWNLAIRVHGDDATQAAIALIVADHYRQLGIRARAELVPLATVLDDLLTHDYQVAIYGLPITPDLNYRPKWHSDQIEAEFGLNLAAYANPQMDVWLDEANRLPGCPPTERAALYQRIQTQLAEERPYDFLVVPDHFLIARETIEGLAPGPFAPFTWNVEAWHVKDEE